MNCDYLTDNYTEGLVYFPVSYGKRTGYRSVNVLDVKAAEVKTVYEEAVTNVAGNESSFRDVFTQDVVDVQVDFRQMTP